MVYSDDYSAIDRAVWDIHHEKALMLELNDENRDAMAKIALSTYGYEPCRICGKILTNEDLQTAVFAGHSQDNRSRAAHGECWQQWGIAEMGDDTSHWAIPE